MLNNFNTVHWIKICQKYIPVDEIKEHIKFASVLFELYQISVVHWRITFFSVRRYFQIGQSELKMSRDTFKIAKGYVTHVRADTGHGPKGNQGKPTLKPCVNIYDYVFFFYEMWENTL